MSINDYMPKWGGEKKVKIEEYNLSSFSRLHAR